MILDFFTMIILLILYYDVFTTVDQLHLKISNIISITLIIFLVRIFKILRYRNLQKAIYKSEINININDFIKEDINSNKPIDEICVICQDNLNNKYIKTVCDHYFHKKCFEDWLKVKLECPLCKSKFDDKIDIVIN